MIALLFNKNVGRIGEEHLEIVTSDYPLLITSVGNYKNHDPEMIIKTAYYWGRMDYQLLYVLEGCLHFKVKGEEIKAPKGTAVLFRPNEPQVYDNFGCEGTETFWIIFTGSKVEDLLNECGMPNLPVSFINAGSTADYPNIFNEMIVELQLKRPNYDKIANLLLKKILIEINRHSTDKSYYQNEIVNQIIKSSHYFNDNYNTKISIDDVAARLHMSPCWYIKNFKQIIGMTPMQYIVSKRLSMAKNLLISSNLPLSEISEMIGYDNPLYFSRLFKKHSGITPSDYRKQFKDRKELTEEFISQPKESRSAMLL